MKAKKGECVQNVSPNTARGMRLGEMSGASWERARAVEKQEVTSAVKYLLSDVRYGNRDVNVFYKLSNQSESLQKHTLNGLNAYRLSYRRAAGPRAPVCTGVLNPIRVDQIATTIVRDL